MAQSKKEKKAAAKARAKQRAKNANKQGSSRMSLEAQIGNLQTALMNMRGLYDAAMEEKAALNAQIVQRDQLLTAIAVEYDGVSVHRATLQQIGSGEYAGYEQELEDDEMFIFAITKEDIADVEPETTEEVEEEDEG